MFCDLQLSLFCISKKLKNALNTTDDGGELMSCYCFTEKMRNDETCGTVITDAAVMTSPQKSDDDVMPTLSPPDISYKVQWTMPDLLHSSM